MQIQALALDKVVYNTIAKHWYMLISALALDKGGNLTIVKQRCMQI